MATTKTQGQFVITSKLDSTYKQTGYSSQCEIMFRDYCGWCLKKKAPKLMQAQFDSQIAKNKDLKLADLFVLTVTAMDDASFKTATAKTVKPAVSKIDKLVSSLVTEMSVLSVEEKTAIIAKLG